MLRIEINLKSASSPREKGIQTGFYGLQYQKKEEKKTNIRSIFEPVKPSFSEPSHSRNI